MKWLLISENIDKLKDHYFYLVTHKDYGTPMKAKYHDDLGGYFELINYKRETEYINQILGESKCKYFMEMPEMPNDYKE